MPEEIEVAPDHVILPTQGRLDNSAGSLPLPPSSLASLDCLLGRLHRIHEQLLLRGFGDTVASRAVDAVLKIGLRALSSGKAARMSSEERAAWIWTVAVNAARRAASTEIPFVSLNYEPPDSRPYVKHDEHDELWKVVSEQIDRLPYRQRQAIILHGLQRLSFRKAAREMGVRPSTVGHHYHAGIARLASALSALDGQVHSEKSCKDSGARAS